jgi:hypothetical protein
VKAASEAAASSPTGIPPEPTGVGAEVTKAQANTDMKETGIRASIDAVGTARASNQSDYKPRRTC